MINERTYELINQYLSGELKGVALDAFKNRLKEDEALQAEVATQYQIIQSIQDARHKELKAYINENVKNGGGIKINTRTLYWAIGSAAAIAFMVGAFFGVQHLMNSQDTMVQEEAKPEVENTATTGIDTGLLNQPTISIDTQTLAIETPNTELKELEPPAIEEVEDDVATDLETEMDESPIGEVQSNEDVGTPETIENANQSKAPTKNLKDKYEYDVKKDEMLSNQIVAVNTINPNFESYKAEDVIATESSKRSGGLFKDRASKTNEAEVEVAEDKAAESEKKVINTRNVELQYWKSPINYTGYNYNGREVKLYGVQTNKKLDFTELDDRLYMKMDGKQYFLENNKKYNRMVEVTNPALLKVLNE